MNERIIDKIKRLWREKQILIVKARIRKLVRRLDVLQYEAFLAYSWAYNDKIDYHILKEQFLPDCHVYGTKVEKYDMNKSICNKCLNVNCNLQHGIFRKECFMYYGEEDEN